MNKREWIGLSFVALVIIVMSLYGNLIFEKLTTPVFEEQQVVVQNLAVPTKADHRQQVLDYYQGADKCTDGQEDCLFNAQFFGDTYHYTGPENYDTFIHFDYSQDPMTAQDN